MAMTVACSMFHGKEIRPLGFSRRGELIGERAASEGGPGWLTPWWRGQTLACAALGCGQPLAPLRLIFGLHECRWILCRKNTGYHATDPKIRMQGAKRGRSWIATKHGDGSLELLNALHTAERDAELYPDSGPSW
jgi:hypothetical protein